ncbi:DUF4388 domain-containing protein [Acidobacteriota bacterium]
MEGELNSIIFPQVLRNFYVNRRTGVLDIEGPGTHARVFLAGGSIVFASSEEKEKRIGEVLVRMEKLTKAQLEGILAEVPKGMKFGRYLLDNCPVNIGDIHSAIEEQIRSIVLPIFNWTDGHYKFTEGVEVDTDELVSSISMADLMIEGVRRMEDFEGIRDFMFELNPQLNLVDEPYARFQKLTLTGEEGYIFSRIDGSLTLKEICSLAPTPEEQTCRIVYALVAAGIVLGFDEAVEQEEASETASPVEKTSKPVDVKEDVDEPEERAESPPVQVIPPIKTPSRTSQVLRPETMKKIALLREQIVSMSHYNVLGVGKDTPKHDITAAFQQRAARYHPDHFHQAEVKEDLEIIFARIVEAWKVLSKPSSKKEYDTLEASSTMPLAKEVAAVVNKEPELHAVQEPRTDEERLADSGPFGQATSGLESDPPVEPDPLLESDPLGGTDPFSETDPFLELDPFGELDSAEGVELVTGEKATASQKADEVQEEKLPEEPKSEPPPRQYPAPPSQIPPQMKPKEQAPIKPAQPERVTKEAALVPDGEPKAPATDGESKAADDETKTSQKEAASQSDVVVEIEKTQTRTAGQSMPAKELYQIGMKYVREKQYWNAIQCLRNAVAADPDSSKYHYELARVLSRNPKWRNEAEAEYHKAIELNPIDANPFVGLGKLYKDGGRIIHAKKAFKQALSVDPTNKVAMEELGQDSSKKTGITGVFQNIFKKKPEKKSAKNSGKKSDGDSGAIRI